MIRGDHDLEATRPVRFSRPTLHPITHRSSGGYRREVTSSVTHTTWDVVDISFSFIILMFTAKDRPRRERHDTPMGIACIERRFYSLICFDIA